MILSGDLSQLFTLQDKLDKFEQQLKGYEYLATLSEADLLENYYPAIVSDNSSPFSNFTQNHRDAYIRLKFRAVNKHN